MQQKKEYIKQDQFHLDNNEFIIDKIMRNPDIFISYNHLSVDLVKSIVKKLEDEAISCWFAPRNLDDEGAGELYDDVIARTIPNVRIVVVVVNDASLQSKWVKMEVTMADDIGKPIIPFEVAPTSVINGLTSRLAIRHKIVAYPNPEERIEQLVKNVKRKLNEIASTDTSQDHPIKYYETEENEFEIDFDFDEGEALYSMKEYAEAATPYLKSAIRGNKRAKDRLCSMFYQLKDINVITNKIWEIIAPQAEKGHCYACFLMSCKYYNNPETNSLAFDYLKKAIRSNTVPLALLRLGIYYGWGLGVKQSSILSMLYYKKAIDAGCKEAYRYIGMEYLYGNDKYSVDERKGVYYLEKGIELYDKGSMSQLANYYLNSPDTIEKAREIAKKMIEQEYYEGYCILGDSYLREYVTYNEIPEENKTEAKKCYLNALNKDETSAYGDLAQYYYYCENNETEAVRMAQRGRSENNGYSINMLGVINVDNAIYYKEQDNQEKAEEYFEKAWNCFEERFNKNGTGSVELGKLFLDYDYVPKQYRSNKASEIINKIKGIANANDNDDEIRTRFVESLQEKLEISAHRGDLEAIIYILRLHCYKKYGNSELNYDIINDVPEIVPLLAFGAINGGNSEMTFYYGKSLTDYEKFPSLYNVYKGISLVENAANKKNAEALNFLIERYGNKKEGNDDDEKFFQRAKEAVDEEVISKENMKYVARLLLHKEDCEDYRLNLDKIRSLMTKHFKSNDAGCISGLGQAFHLLYPDFDEQKVFTDYQNATSKEQWLLYAKNYANAEEIDVELQDSYLEKFYSLLTFDESLKDNKDNYIQDIDELLQAMTNYEHSYKAVCRKNSIPPTDYYFPKVEYIFPYMPSSVCCRIAYDTFSLFLSLRNHMPEIYDPMLPIIRSDESMLNYIETIKDMDLQLFLISLVEIKIDIESVMLGNQSLYTICKDKDYQKIVNNLNILLDKFKDKVTADVSSFTTDNLPDFSMIKVKRAIDINHWYQGDKEEDSTNKISDDSNSETDNDEFERLLNDFINSSSEEEITKLNK